MNYDINLLVGKQVRVINSTCQVSLCGQLACSFFKTEYTLANCGKDNYIFFRPEQVCFVKHSHDMLPAIHLNHIG